MSETQTPLDPYRAWDIVARLRDEIETLRRERDEALAAQGYLYIGRDGKPILARDLEDQRDALRALLRDAAEVLEVFARRVDEYFADTDDGYPCDFGDFRLGDLRSARAVLEKIKIEIDNANRQKKD